VSGWLRVGRAESLFAVCPAAEAMTTPANGHEHAFMLWATFHRAPVGAPPEHTSFVVLLCEACGAYLTFPPQNFGLCTEPFKARFRAAAAAAGWHEDRKGGK
jgi:hypothetical protein